MNTSVLRDVDHRHDDDSAAFAMLAAAFVIFIIAVFSYFVLRPLPPRDIPAYERLDFSAEVPETVPMNP